MNKVDFICPSASPNFISLYNKWISCPWAVSTDLNLKLYFLSFCIHPWLSNSTVHKIYYFKQVNRIKVFAGDLTFSGKVKCAWRQFGRISCHENWEVLGLYFGQNWFESHESASKLRWSNHVVSLHCRFSLFLNFIFISLDEIMHAEYFDQCWKYIGNVW